ncbi:hypothetical protein BGZ83_012092 [Gryganskiella cystojenkinii]|nr:hypothetical protein BGZ83_012092 [Gryganskiella cystojenkinii]
MTSYINNHDSSASQQHHQHIDAPVVSQDSIPQASSPNGLLSSADNNSTFTTTDASGYPDKSNGLVASSPSNAIQHPHEHHKFNQVQHDPSVVRDESLGNNAATTTAGMATPAATNRSETRAGDRIIDGTQDQILDDQHHHHRHAVHSEGTLQDPLHQPIVETMEQLGNNNTGLGNITGVPNYIK